MKCTRKNIKVIITLYYGGWIPISGAGNWKYSLHDDGTILVKNDGMILPIAVHNLGAKSGDEAIISIMYGMVDIKLKEKGEDKMDEKNFTDCDGRTGNCKIQLDLIRISSSVYSGDIWVERYIESKKINTIHVQLFNYHVPNRLYETLRGISKRNDPNYDSFYCQGNPISMPGIVVGSNSPSEKIFWEDLGKVLRMLSNID